jgi:hypothetical protein
MWLSLQFITNQWGLRGGHRDLFMLDALRNIWPGPDHRGRSGEFSSGEFNRAE